MMRIVDTDAERQAVLDALREPDDTAFTVIAERYRRRLHLHCYRMLGSFHDAEDAVQETMLRAWRSRGTYAGRSTFTAWLYRIATNTCLTTLARRPRSLLPFELVAATDATATDGLARAEWLPDLPWLEPYPDHLLEPATDEDVAPDSAAVSRETIELAYLAAIQHLPPRQRAVLILRDALGWSERETAALLDSSVAAVKAALTRARSTMRAQLPSHRLDWSASAPDPAERAVLDRFMAAFDRADAGALTSLLCEDARQSMPPGLLWFNGRASIAAHHGRLLDGSMGEFRLVPLMANRQPALAAYLRPPGGRAFRLSGLNVFRVEGGLIAEITSFGPGLCKPFGLPTKL